ncbi:unnamed protein product [Lampetra fluviatilis]
MARAGGCGGPLGLRASLCVLLLLCAALAQGTTSAKKSRQRRDISSDQPRVSTESGQLVFHTGNGKAIEFRTGTGGEVRIGDISLSESLAQVRTNQKDIVDLKAGATGVNVTAAIHQLDVKIQTLDGKVTTIEQDMGLTACASSPCLNGAHCVNLYKSFYCVCPSNWKGTRCNEDVNECQIYAGTPMGCQNGGTCHNTPGTYSCSCMPEFTGPHCVTKFDDCQAGSQALCVHGVCVDGVRINPNEPRFECICEGGYTQPGAGGSPACSADLDECAQPIPPCSANPPVSCFNTVGSYYCGACPSGWQGNGYSCTDVNECAMGNGGCSTVPPVQCLNTMGSYHCGPCPSGYEGDGRTCTAVEVCSINNGGCHSLATCTAVPGSSLPICTCPPGYLGNGYGPNGCVASGGNCNPNPCVHGHCIEQTTGFVCACEAGWSGTICNQNINECASSPCLNGGTCVDGTDSYTCTCTSSWTGTNCQTPTQVCGGWLSGPAGSFSYPNTPGSESYDHQVSCAWVIEVASNQVVRITFPFFHLEGGSTCQFDWLQIHDGSSASTHMLGKFCGTTVPSELISSHNTLYFWFRSDHSVNAGGFTVVWESRAPLCGGELSNDYGDFSSPGYPGNYPPNRDCFWTVSVSPGRLITFAFGALHLETHPDCNYDFLEIRDGLLELDPVLGRFCSSGNPPPVQSTGPSALVHFHSDASVSDRGFHVTYTTSPSDPGCGGTYTDSDGVLISPNWPNPYPHNRQCIYLVRQPVGETVALTFTDMQLEGHSSCAFDFVEVRDGSSESAPLIGKYCSSDIPAPITSSSYSLWLRFKSDHSVSRAGFRALYQVACGGQFSGMGEIRTPYHPNAYPHGRTCEYVISQPQGKSVTLNFLTFDIENASDCRYDYVEIRDGGSEDANLIGRYCGTGLPPPAQSTQSLLYVKFVTDALVANNGFTAQYDESPCGATYTAQQGTVSSPGHPTPYPHGANCTWHVAVQPGFIVRLTFTTFTLEYHQNCAYDYVELYDNSTTASESLIGRFCGRSVPPSITTTTNVLTILFVADASISTEGFSASYVALNASTTCGQVFTDPSGVMTSPNYPANYPGYRECIYTITVGAGRQIALNFTDFLLEGPGNGNCPFDYLEIRNGGYETSPLVGKYCGTSAPPLLLSHGNKLWFKFRTDGSVEARGFSAHWDGTATGCGATLTGATGSFTSPNYPLPYTPNEECYWLIRASAGSRLRLTFADFHLESHGSCAYDYLAVFDGSSANSPQLANLCHDGIPPPIESSGDHMYVKLRTDGSISAGGFFATYTQICQGTVIVNRSRGHLESPNFPNVYPHNSNCNWLISATLGNTLNYTFLTFQLEHIVFDYVELFDGSDASAPLIGRFGGTDRPPAGQTTGQHLYTTFVTDSSVAYSGFQMSWYQNGCGGDLTGPSGEFNSPGYPNNYPNNRECLWFLETSQGSSVQLTIDVFEVESHPDCNYDVLEVYGGPDLSSVRLVQLCHSQPAGQPHHVSSTGNHMIVRFKTDVSVSKKGFHASWQERPGGCGGNVSAPSGEIHSPNYPQPYGTNVDCSWLVSVARNHRVQLAFNTFDLETHSNCNYDYVAVHDGSNEHAPLLAKLCGTALPPALAATGNELFVRFRSDGSVQRHGFSASFSTGCGYRIIADAVGGALTSPLHPHNYPGNQNCSWIIEAHENFGHVTVSFTEMDIENRAANCSTDHLEVLDGDNPWAPSVARLCGRDLPAPITSHGNALHLNFVSDNVLEGAGFRLVYGASYSACGGTFHGETGAFNSPNYPEPYPSDTECTWVLQSSPGNRVQLTFRFFQLDGPTACGAEGDGDLVEVRENNATGPLVGRFCGASLPPDYTLVARHVLWVKFVSNGHGNGAGFMAEFSHQFGNDITGTSGQVASPLWPRTYPHNVDYRWTIRAGDASERVHITFLEMDIEDSTVCTYDKLSVYNGLDSSAPLLGTFCGLTPPGPLRSTGSSISLFFHTDSSVAGRGFLVDWRVFPGDIEPSVPPTIAPGACGGELVAGDAARAIFSPGWPGEYGDNLGCAWVIRAPQGHSVQLDVLFMDIEMHGSCLYDYLGVHDGDSLSSPRLARLCGRDPPGPLHSTGRSMYLYFYSDVHTRGLGFNATFRSGCGGRYNVDQGVITSPGRPSNYPPNSDCVWHVTASPGYVISTSFTPPFQVQGTGVNCAGDFLELRNGANVTSPPLASSGDGTGRYCGNSPPPTLSTTDRDLYVHFHSDGGAENHGFEMRFQAHGAGCGGVLGLTHQSPSSTVTSPNHPNNYPQNVDCVWIITAPSDEAIQLDFVEPFYIEPHPNCVYDYLEVRDGGSNDAPLITRLCGSQKPSTQKSTGNVMRLRFRTDSSVTHPGFNVRYSLAACGGTVVGQNGHVTSPNYSVGEYPNNLNCEWHVEALTGHYLILTFTHMALQSSASCSQDYVEIREYNSTGLLLGRFCGQDLPTVVMETSDSFAHVRFVTDSAGGSDGFVLNFRSSVDECGGDLATPTGTITSPNYPNLYPHSRVCEWRITVPLGRRVTLTIHDFLTQDHPNCAIDYLAVYNGLRDNSPKVAQLCGDVASGTRVQSSGNTMRVRFRTDAHSSSTGFRATYHSDEEAVCGGILSNPAGGNFTSPGYDGQTNYVANLNCEWTIENPRHANSSIYIEFFDFKLEHHQTCEWDYIEFRVDSGNGELLTRLCGQSAPAVPFVMAAPQLWVHFLSDPFVEDRGFAARYVFTDCGGLQIAESGEISSPNFPAPYGNKNRCAWILEAPLGHTITLTFTTFHLESHSTCLWDAVSIFNGGAPSSPVIGHYCGMAGPGTIRSGSNKLAILFSSDSSVVAAGFHAVWEADSAGCGGIIHAEDGSIKSPGWPNPFPADSECTWTLVSHESQHLTLTFDPNFNIPTSDSSCSSSHVQVWNGRRETDESRLLLACGTTAPSPVAALANRVTVRFQATGATTAAGFSASFSSSCGVTLDEPQGQILSPSYPAHYGDNLDCHYLINPGNDFTIILSFQTFQVEGHSTCAYDFLKVYGGTSESGQLLATLCGSTIPGVVSAHGPMFLHFHSDPFVEDNGFLAAYQAIPCGGSFTNPSGFISSPTFGQVNYHNNMNCSYHIQVEENRIVNLKFNYMHLEAHSQCHYDYVAVYDGADTSAPLLGTFCGTEVPLQLHSSARDMFLLFVTDASVTAGGWQAAYRTTLGPAQGCGGMLTGDTGELTSPDINGDGLYESDLDCRWTVSVEPNNLITLTFSAFELESAIQDTCHYDYVSVFDGESALSPMVGRYCGAIVPLPITSFSNFLHIHFHTDSSVQRAGFHATYQTSASVCGGVINATAQAQTVTSPGFPDAYPTESRCRWTLDAPAQESVRVTVTAFSLPAHQTCSNDYLEIRDQPMGDYGQVRRYCGTDMRIPEFYSIGRTVHLDFKVDTYEPGNGFSLSFQTAGCSREYTASYGYLASPGWPDVYPHNMDCTTVLRAPAGSLISLFFSAFTLETHPNCQFDYLEVHNGSDATAPSLAKLCGAGLPDPVFPHADVLFLHFVSDFSLALNGYEITWTSSPAGCGGILHGDHGSFTSPDFPGTYPNNSTCEWLLEVAVHRRATLRFPVFHVDDPGDCERNYVMVHDGPNISSPPVGTFCGQNDNIADFTSSGYQLFVRFQAEGSSVPAGFRLTWTSS